MRGRPKLTPEQSIKSKERRMALNREYARVHYWEKRDELLEQGRQWRLANPDFALRWRQENKASWTASIKEWHKKHPESLRKAVKGWVARNPTKAAAHNQVRLALLRGDLERLPCRDCGNSKTHGHHPDYTKPLDVIWLCPPHHKQEHIKSKKLEN